MRITPRNYVRKFQEGGPMDAEDQADMQNAPEQGGAPGEMGGPEQGGAPEEMGGPQGQQDPIAMIAQAAAQALQTQDCQLAMQVCQAFLQIIQQMQGGGGAPEQGAPVYRKGGKLAYRIQK